MTVIKKFCQKYMKCIKNAYIFKCKDLPFADISAKPHYFNTPNAQDIKVTLKTWKLLRSLLSSKSKTSNQTFNTHSINNQTSQ